MTSVLSEGDIVSYSLTSKNVKNLPFHFGCKNHFPAHATNGWKTNHLNCVPQHFFQKVEECSEYLTPIMPIHTYICWHSSFLHPKNIRLHYVYSASFKRQVYM